MKLVTLIFLLISFASSVWACPNINGQWNCPSLKKEVRVLLSENNGTYTMWTDFFNDPPFVIDNQWHAYSDTRFFKENMQKRSCGVHQEFGDYFQEESRHVVAYLDLPEKISPLAYNFVGYRNLKFSFYIEKSQMHIQKEEVIYNEKGRHVNKPQPIICDQVRP